MRKFVTSLFALILSGLAGGLVAQELAVITNAQEEYILVFMVSVLVTFIVTFVFFVAQLMTDPVAAVARTGKWSLIVFAALIALLVALILYADSSAAVVPGLVTIVVQWLFVRWRVSRGLVKAEASA